MLGFLSASRLRQSGCPEPLELATLSAAKGLLRLVERVQVGDPHRHSTNLVVALNLLADDEVIEGVDDALVHVVELLVLSSDRLRLLLERQPEVLPYGASEFLLKTPDMVLVEPNLPHRLVECEDEGVPLLEDLGVAQPENVVEDVGASQLEGVDLEVLVLDYLHELVDLQLRGLTPELQLLLSEGHHLVGEIVDALVEVLEGEDDSRPRCEGLHRQAPVPGLGQEDLDGVELADHLQVRVAVNVVEECGAEPLLGGDVLVDLVAAHL